MAGAPKENNNAEKWSLEDANIFCNSVLDILENNKSIRTLGGACLEAGKYESLINYLSDKFNIEFESIKKAKEIVKSRLIEQGLDNEVSTAMAIFILKNNHDMKDRVDTTSKDKEVKSTTIVNLGTGVKPQ